MTHNKINELFLWQKEADYYLLSPTAYLSTPVSDCHLPTSHNAHFPLPQCLPNAFIEIFCQYSSHTRLYLHNSLPDAWQTMAWETLSLEGEPLGDSYQMIRYADFNKTTSPSTHKKWLLLNHWEEPAFFSQELQSDKLEIKTGKRINLTLKQTDLSGYQGLVIIAHGNETTSEPLLTQDGEPWALPLPNALPSTVFIIACASASNHFSALIKDCLKKGGQTVIAPNGKLDAEAMRDFLTDFFNSTKSIADYLQHTQNSEHGGTQCLQLYGALQTLVSPEQDTYRQLSLDYYYRNQAILETLREQHAIGQEKAAQQWLHSTLKCFEQLPQSTQALLIDYCDYLAEQWANDLSPCISKWRRQLEDLPCYKNQEHTFKYIVQARTARRYGDYEHACMLWINADANADTKNDFNDLSVKNSLYGLLLNILIDLNLPQSARFIYEQLENNLRYVISPTRDDDKLKCLDRKARLLMREAKYPQAIQNYQLKKNSLPSSTDDRDLITLVYAQAWVQAKKPETLNHIEELMQTLSNKQDDTNNRYRIRSLMLAAWRTQNATLIEKLSHYANEIIEQLISPFDKGPAAMSFFFGYLANIEGFQQIDNLEKSIGALEKDSYFFELALLLSFCGRLDAARQALKKYHKMRKQCLTHLSPFWQEQAIDITKECQEREQQEHRLIESFNEQDMLKYGIIPL